MLFNDFYRDESSRMIFMIHKQLKNVLMYQVSLIVLISSRCNIEEEVSEAALGLSRRPHFILTNRTAHAMTKIVRFEERFIFGLERVRSVQSWLCERKADLNSLLFARVRKTSNSFDYILQVKLLNNMEVNRLPLTWKCDNLLFLIAVRVLFCFLELIYRGMRA